jgi:hypothetical protein
MKYDFRNLTLGRLASIALTVGAFYSPFAFGAQTFSPCDLNQDGVVNVTDVTIAVNMALGQASCTSSIKGTTGCNVVTVQRVVQAALPGGSCHPTVLSWAASTASNLAGYNVYRTTASSGTGYSKLNTALLPSPTFTDGTSQPGVTYYYAVTAVDTSGNESTYSTPPAPAPIPTP